VPGVYYSGYYSVVSGTIKFDRGLKAILHDELIHWLDVPERIEYKLGVMMCRVCPSERKPVRTKSRHRKRLSF